MNTCTKGVNDDVEMTKRDKKVLHDTNLFTKLKEILPPRSVHVNNLSKLVLHCV